MQATNPLYAVVAVIVALATIWLIKLKHLQPAEKGRYDTIDGLRGYLAFFVFLHHSDVNYNYMKTGVWEATISKLYTLFGFGSVQLFFMITAFLFFSKLLNSDQRKTDWSTFYLARILRLYPLYLFSLVFIFGITAYLSQGILRESYWELFKHVASWLLMGLFGVATINELPQSHHINAGVIWSLSYEWMFYLLIPTLALLLKKKTSFLWLIFSFAAVVLLAQFHPILGGMAFFGGIIAAYLVKNEKFTSFARSQTASIIIVSCLCLAVFSVSSYDNIVLVLLTIAFILIACGNDLYGLLTHRISIAFGDLSYSIYLLHGILLTITFHLFMDKQSSFSPLLYWSFIALITPILVIVCYGTYHFIEYPAMKSANTVMRWIKLISRKHA